MRQRAPETWLIAALLGLLMVACGMRVEAEPIVEPFVEYSHVSDVSRGFPLNEQDETQHDYIGAGVTIVAGKLKRFEIDISHGRKRITRDARTESGSKLTVRFYWGRK